MKCPRKFVLRSIQEGLVEEEESLEDFGNTDNANKQNFTDSSLLQNVSYLCESDFDFHILNCH